MTTPSTLILQTRSIPRMGDGGFDRALAPRTPGAVISSSSDFDWLSSRLFSLAQLLTCTSSSSQVCELMLGTSKYVSSANLNNRLTWLTERRSEALTTYDAGPIAEPWITLARMSAKDETDPANCVQCELSLIHISEPTRRTP